MSASSKAPVSAPSSGSASFLDDWLAKRQQIASTAPKPADKVDYNQPIRNEPVNTDKEANNANSFDNNSDDEVVIKLR